MKTTLDDQATLVKVLSPSDALITAGSPIEFRKYVKHLKPSKNLNRDVLVLVRGQDEEEVDDEVEPTLDIALTFFAKIRTNPASRELFFKSDYNLIASPVFEYEDEEYAFVFKKNLENNGFSLVLVKACNLLHLTHRKVKVCIG